MRRENPSSRRRRPGYSRKETRNKGKTHFTAGGTYLLIPLLGIVLALTLVYFARDFFIQEKGPEYSRPAITANKDLTDKKALVGPESIEGNPGTEQTQEDRGKSLENEGSVQETLDDNEALSERKVLVAVPAENEKSQAETLKEPSAAIKKENSQEKNSGEIIASGPYQEDPSWGVQIAMVVSREDAERLAARVKEKGFYPDITKPGSYYRVRIRGGRTRESALYIEELLSKEGYDTLVVKSDKVKAIIPETSSNVFTAYQEAGTWGVQVGMLKNRSDAERLAGNITESGFNVKITKPGSYYRVRVNGGESRETAERIEKLLVREGYDTLVVRSGN